MGEGVNGLYNSSVAVDGDSGDKIPSSGKKIGASLEIIAQARSGGETDGGVAVAQADGKRRRNQGSKGDDEVGAVLELSIPVRSPEGDLIFAGAVDGEDPAMNVAVSAKVYGKGRAVTGTLMPANRTAPGGPGGVAFPKSECAAGGSGDGNQFHQGIASAGSIQNLGLGGEGEFIRKVPPGKIGGVPAEKLAGGNIESQLNGGAVKSKLGLIGGIDSDLHMVMGHGEAGDPKKQRQDPSHGTKKVESASRRRR